MDEVGKLGGIPDEEDGGVVEDPVPITFVSPELDRKATGITSSIGGSRLATDCGEAGSGADFFPDLVKEGLRGDIAKIMSYFEVAMSTGAFGMYDTLRDTLAIEVCKEIYVMKVWGVGGQIM
jgi:hypothetical protein